MINLKGGINVRFSLGSLLVACAITAVLALSFLPLAKSTHGAMAVEQGAEELARELQATRQLAVANNSTYKVLFDRGAGAYYILSEEAFALSRYIQLPPGVEWEKLSTNPIVFYGTGRCAAGGTYSLVFQGLKYRVQVVVATHSGRVRVERGNP